MTNSATTESKYVVRATNAITLVVKICGVVIVVNEALFEQTRDPVLLAISAFMMAGAVGLENFVARLFGGK